MSFRFSPRRKELARSRFYVNGSFVVVSAKKIKSEHDASTAESDNALNVTFEIKLLFSSNNQMR
jgi:hypothetical protein